VLDGFLHLRHLVNVLNPKHVHSCYGQLKILLIDTTSGELTLIDSKALLGSTNIHFGPNNSFTLVFFLDWFGSI
jgi:hypothetical protein